MANTTKVYDKIFIKKNKAGDREYIQVPYAILADPPDLSVYAKLAGDTFTGDVTFNKKINLGQGDANCLYLGADGRLNGPSNRTLFGLVGGATVFGHQAYPLRFRGSATRPQYTTDGSTYKDLALKSDIPTIPTDYVKYTAQTLTDAQKSQARSNIGAGTSNFSGNYNDLSNKPTYVSSVNGDSGAITNVAKTDTANTFTASQIMPRPSDETQVTLWSYSGFNAYSHWVPGSMSETRTGVGYKNSGIRVFNGTTEAPSQYYDVTMPSQAGQLVTNTFAKFTGETSGITVPYRVFEDENAYTAAQSNPQNVKYTSQTYGALIVNTDANSRTAIVDGRIDNKKNGTKYELTLPMKTGTLATTSEIPATFDDLTRIKKQGYTGGDNTVKYFKLASLPVYNNGGNYASFIITGRMGGWQADNMSFVNMILYNRNGEGGGYINVANSAFFNLCDIIMYRETDGTSTAYLKVKGYYTFDINVNTYQATNVYTGTDDTPTGTLKWTASTQADRLAVSGGVAYVNGFTLPKQIQVNGTIHNPNSNGLVNLGNISGATTYSDSIYADDVTTIFDTNEYGNAFIFTANDAGQGSRQIYSIYVNGVKTVIFTTDASTDYVDNAVCINISRFDHTSISFIIVNVFYKNTIKTIHINDASNSTIDLGYSDDDNRTSSLYLNITKGTI